MNLREWSQSLRGENLFTKWYLLFGVHTPKEPSSGDPTNVLGSVCGLHRVGGNAQACQGALEPGWCSGINVLILNFHMYINKYNYKYVTINICIYLKCVRLRVRFQILLCRHPSPTPHDPTAHGPRCRCPAWAVAGQLEAGTVSRR